MGGVALKIVAVGFTENPNKKRQILSPHLGFVADMAVTMPVRASSLEAVFRVCNRRTEESAAPGGGRGGGGGSKADAKGRGTLSMSASCSTLEGGDRRWVGAWMDRWVNLEGQLANGVLGRR